MIDYTFIQEEGILFLNYSGVIKIDDFPQFLAEIEKMQEEYILPKVLLICSDYSQAKIEMTVENIPELFEMMQGYFSLFENIYEAFIHVNPFETALSQIASNQAKKQDTYVSEVFSTRESALEWLKKH
jgi:hypothetical protein